MKFFTGILCAIAIAVIILGVSGAAARNPGEPLTIGTPPSSPTNYFDYDEIGKTHNSFDPPTVRWHWDDIRRENKLAVEESMAAAEFYKTNTDPGLGWVQQHYLRLITSNTTNDVELGFRSDGMVVWRVPPEAKP